MKGRTTSNVQSNRSTKNGKRDLKTQKSNGAKRSSEQERLKALDTKGESNVSLVVNDITTQPELSEVDKTVDDVAANGSLDTHQESNCGRITEKTEKEETVNDEEESKDIDAMANEKRNGSGSCSETCEGVNVVKTVEVCDDASNGGLRGGSDESEASDVKEKCEEEEEVLREKVENLEARIEKLEEELREVASLEISLYSVVPDHSSSAHKLHTPARRISRLYIHA